jgi:ectoine hydroxylase-related dioxygenase (phytanoyl-CoA dioxygenase family)
MELNNIELSKLGYTIIRNVVDEDFLDSLRNSIDEEFTNHRKKQIENNTDIKANGVAHHILLTNTIFIDLLEYLQNKNLFVFLQNHFFKSKFIVHSMSALNNLPNQDNYYPSIVHRDIRFYSGEVPILLNCLLMIDDFTSENGGTYLLPYSHLNKEKVTDAEFFSKAVQATGKKGDVLIFNSNVWHAAAPNKTNENRRAIPIVFSKSTMKQLLDYPRAIGYDKMDTFNSDMQQLLGYHSRVPASLDEWYQPNDKRLYKKEQD